MWPLANRPCASGSSRPLLSVAPVPLLASGLQSCPALASALDSGGIRCNRIWRVTGNPHRIVRWPPTTATGFGRFPLVAQEGSPPFLAVQTQLPRRLPPALQPVHTLFRNRRAARSVVIERSACLGRGHNSCPTSAGRPAISKFVWLVEWVGALGRLFEMGRCASLGDRHPRPKRR